MAENEGGGDSKFLTGFLLGFLVGVLIALGVGASLVMVVGRREAMHAQAAMREAEMARAMADEQRAMAEEQRAKAKLDAFKVQNDLAAQREAVELEKRELAAQLKAAKEKLAEGKGEQLGDPNVEREGDAKKDE